MSGEQLYKIGEAAQLVALESYVLRYWEKEFPQLCPKRTPKGQRLYSDKDLEILAKLRYLLHEQGLTIDGARKVLEGKSELSSTGEESVCVQEKKGFESQEKKDSLTEGTVFVLKDIEKKLLLIKKLLEEHANI